MLRAAATPAPARRGRGDDVQDHPGRRMSEREFVAWVGEKTRAEWEDGEVILMSPVSLEHSGLGTWLLSLLCDFATQHDAGSVFGPEVLVRLPRQRRRRMPDACFVRADRRGILRPNHIEGPPDLIIEIVSPDSTGRDYRDKYNDYQRAGVREYWVVDPLAQEVEAHALGKDKKYKPIEEEEGKIASSVLKGFFLRPAWLFAANRNKLLPKARKELGIKG